MSSTARALVLTSAFLHASWNLFAKRAGVGTRGAPFVFSFSLLTALIYAPVALALGAGSVSSLSAAGWWAVAGSALLHVGYFLALQRGYQVGDLSVVYPLARGLGPLLATLGAIALFGERPSSLALAGTGLVVVATMLLVGGRGADGRLAPGLAWGAITALFIGAYTLWDARAVATIGVQPLIYLWWTELGRGLLLAPLALSDRQGLKHVWRAHWRSVLAIAVLSPAAYALVLYAFTLAPVSLVAPTRELSVLIGALFGVQLLGEGDRTRRLLAAAAMVVGVALLARG